MNALLSIGFRPFFLLAALIAVINPIIWISTYLGHTSLNITTSSAFWHGHEMIFGFSGALIAGFILTASANWTSTLPYQGKPIGILALLWIIERLSFFLPINELIVFILMNLFFPALTFMLFLKLRKFPKQRNMFITILIGITSAKLLYSAGHMFLDSPYEENGRHIAVGLIRFIVLLIAGRVLPFFMRKKITGLNISVPGWLNPLALAPIALLAIPLPETTPKLLLVIIYLWAIVIGAVRQGMWLPHKSIKVPMLLVLHVGVGFILLGLMQELIGLYHPHINFSQIPLHTMMAGGLGVIGLGIMTRVSLGHTGRVIEADKVISFAYICVALGAFIRITVPLFWPEHYVSSLYYAVVIWTLSFAIFFIKFLGKLTSPRPDGKAY
jgi:uncharacterized protein involved in response to NO